MTKTELALQIRKQFPAPKGIRVSDDDLIESVFQEAVSGDQHTLHFLARHNVTSGLFSTWRKAVITKKQAELLDHAVQIARNLHEIDTIRTAQSVNIPRDVYSEVRRMQTETEEIKTRVETETEQKIRFERERAALERENFKHEYETKIASGLQANLAAQHEQQALECEITELLKELEELEAKPRTPATERQISWLEERIDTKRASYRERFRN